MNPKTILFDGRFLSLENAGLGRYSSELFTHLLKENKGAFKFILLILPKTRLSEELKTAIADANGFVEVIEFDAKHYSIAEQTRLRKFLNEIKPDLVHFTNLNHPVFYKGPFVVTIHDLTLYRFSERAGVVKKLAYNYVINKAATNAKKIFSVSEFARRELIKKFSLSPSNVVVSYNGIDPKFKKITNPRSLERAIKYRLNRPYFLYVGQWRSHKNLLTLVRAYCEIRKELREPIDLVFAGKIDPKYPQLIEEVKKLSLENSVKFTGFVSDEDLPIIYNNALAFVFPSYSEGFGLPALEAQSCAVPVISSNTSSLPEVLGKGALYFNPSSSKELSKKMLEIVNDKKLREDLISEGLKNAQRFSWSVTAQKTLEVYREVLYK